MLGLVELGPADAIEELELETLGPVVAIDELELVGADVEFAAIAGGEVTVELVLLVEFAAKAGAMPAALIKMQSNASAVALILTKDEFHCRYLSNYLK